MKRLFWLAPLALACACGSNPKHEDKLPPTPALSPLPQTVDEAVANTRRNPADITRDKYRHPNETLKFFGVEPQMNVVEIWPSTGWYTEILAPLLATQGHYVAANRFNREDNAHVSQMNDQLQAWMQANPDVGAKVSVIEFDPPKAIELASENSVDMVLTFRNVHNWMQKGAAPEAFRAFFRALKPGGILGVEEHRAKARGKQDPKAASGYVQEKYVIDLAKKAGFKLVARSEINANPADTKDYAQGVWTLPPVLRAGDKNRDRYLQIGESDRMTLKFVKPDQR